MCHVRVDERGYSNLDCGGQRNRSTFKVNLYNHEGKSFVISLHDDTYISDVFQGAESEVVFSKTSAVSSKPLRLKDITSIKVYTVKQEYRIRQERPAGLTIKIMVKDTPLLDDFSLKPIEDGNTSDFILNAKEVLAQAQTKGCSLTVEEAKSLLGE